MRPIALGRAAASSSTAANASSQVPASEEQPGNFEGGRLVFHDAECDWLVLPEPGVLVAFESGAANLHAVQQVRRGSRSLPYCQVIAD